MAKAEAILALCERLKIHARGGFAREWYGRHHDPNWAKWTRLHRNLWPNVVTQHAGRAVPLLVRGWILRGGWGFDYGMKFGRYIGQCGKCGLDRFPDRTKFFCKPFDLLQVVM